MTCSHYTKLMKGLKFDSPGSHAQNFDMSAVTSEVSACEKQTSLLYLMSWLRLTAALLCWRRRTEQTRREVLHRASMPWRSLRMLGRSSEAQSSMEPS